MIGATYLPSGNWNPICLPHLPACGQEIHYPFYFSPPSSPRLKCGTKDRRNRLLLSRRWSRRSKSKLVHSKWFASIFIVEIIPSNTVDRVAGNARSMRIIVSRKKKSFSFRFYNKKKEEKEKDRRRLRWDERANRIVCQRFEEGAKRKWQETDYNLFCAANDDARQLINVGRIRDNAHSLHAYVRARCRIIIH